MASPFEQRFQSILKAHITPLLKSHGFAKAKSTYIKSLDELAWVVNIQRSAWNDSEHTSFTANCRIFVPSVMPIYAGIRESLVPHAGHCLVSARIGMLAEQHFDAWWDLTPIDDSMDVDADIGRDIAHRLAQHGLPFLGRFHTRRDVVDFLLSPRSEQDKHIAPMAESRQLIFAAILFHLMGDPVQSEACFEAASRAEARSRIEPVVPIVRRRL